MAHHKFNRHTNNNKYEKNESVNHESHERVPTGPSPGGAYTAKRGIRERLIERFKEKPATKAEIEQLELDTKREQLKTLKSKARHSRPSRYEGMFGGNSSVGRVSRKVQSSSAFGGGGFGMSSGMMSSGEGMGFGSGLDNMLGSGGRSKEGRKTSRQPDMGFCSGMDEMLGSCGSKKSKTERGFGSGLHDMFGL